MRARDFAVLLLLYLLLASLLSCANTPPPGECDWVTLWGSSKFKVTRKSEAAKLGYVQEASCE